MFLVKRFTVKLWLVINNFHPLVIYLSSKINGKCVKVLAPLIVATATSEVKIRAEIESSQLPIYWKLTHFINKLVHSRTNQAIEDQGVF